MGGSGGSHGQGAVPDPGAVTHSVCRFLQHTHPYVEANGPLRNVFSVFATAPCRGLSLSRWMVSAGSFRVPAVAIDFCYFFFRTNFKYAV